MFSTQELDGVPMEDFHVALPQLGVSDRRRHWHDAALRGRVPIDETATDLQPSAKGLESLEFLLLFEHGLLDRHVPAVKTR